ncbi:unnamed protein product [Orchesella dallaii]|uniref:Uncharacterized protein n=1 Tax=Orchesella dallaii TaxID=48710 RepID=A0ABP1RT11_9HEXA
MHFIIPFPIIMFFILSSLLILTFVISVIAYNVCLEVVILLLKNSRHVHRFKTRISHIVHNLFIQIKKDVFFQLETLCETDEDEDENEQNYENEYKSLLFCEFMKSPPKEEVIPDLNNNNTGRPRARAAGVGRAVRRRPAVAMAQPVAPVPVNARVRPVNRPNPVVRLPAILNNRRVVVAVAPPPMQNLVDQLEALEMRVGNILDGII